jgi:glucose/arabinose dehydrogenase
MRTRLSLAVAGFSAFVFTAVAPLYAALGDLRLFEFARGFSAPLAFVQDPANPAVQFVAEQGGRIRVIVAGQVQTTDFLNLAGSIASGGEQGLLGLAFPPDAAASGRFYVNFTNPQGHTVVARFKRSANPLVADPASRVDLQWSSGQRLIPQPYANHNGGCLQFGPDGYLYISMGDGGSGDDPQFNGQKATTLLGKMLRIDVSVPDSDPKGFRIPADNPFLSSSIPGVLPEIWAFGLRNPWRFSFDSPALGGTGAMFIGDVGQGLREEVDYQPPGAGGQNYGWRMREGSLSHFPNDTPAFLPFRNPIFEYDHSVGASITGGYVYRGGAPELRGRYFFADYVKPRIWSMAISVDSSGEAVASDLFEHTPDAASATGLGNVSSFGIDSTGEIYVVDHTRGMILRLGAVPPPVTNLRIIQ